MNGPEISILIASVGRPSLVETVRSARVSADAIGMTYEVVVADDSLDGAAATLLANTGLNADNLIIVHTASNNISTARNACLETAAGEWLAFIDDDEWAEVDWLARHMEALRTAGADAGFGPVKAHYDAGLPGWIVKLDPYSRRIDAPGSQVARGSTANALVRKASLTSRGLLFDERLGRTGGEDSDLFGRLFHAGGIMIATDALVHESVPADRARLPYLLRRSLRHGQTYAQNRLVGCSKMARFGFFLSTTAKLIGAVGGIVATAPFGKSRYIGFMLSAGRNIGKLRAQLRLPLVHYYGH